MTQEVAPVQSKEEVVRPQRRTRPGIASAFLRLLSVYGLLLLLVVLILAFSVGLPNTFPTAMTFNSIVNEQVSSALLALAVMIPMSAGQFDLSVGYLLGPTHILAIGLQVQKNNIHVLFINVTVSAGVAWPLVCLVVLLTGAAIGLVNGLLVTRARIDSFIATLGMGTVVYGISEWYTGGQEISGNLPSSFLALASNSLSIGPFSIPYQLFYLLTIAIVLWLVFEYLPIGRYLYAIGANPRSAELTGIPVNRFILLSFVASGLLAAFAGVLTASRLGVGQSNVGPDFLLPAFTGALLGATSIRPGRVNTWGTIVAIALLGVGIAGIEQMGAAFFVGPFFNGLTLIIAVGLAAYAARRRAWARARKEAAAQT